MTDPTDQQDSERVLACAKALGEHYDAVEILVSRHDGNNGTRTICKGAGNRHARLGLVREWLLNTEEQIREEGRAISRRDDV